MSIFIYNFVFLVANVLSFFRLMSIINFNINRICIVSWAIALNIRAIDVIIQISNIFVSSNMWFFGNINCFLVSRPSNNHLIIFPFSSIIPLLSYFLQIVMLMLQLYPLMMSPMFLLLLPSPNAPLDGSHNFPKYINPLLCQRFSLLLSSCLFAWTSFFSWDFYSPILARWYRSRTPSLN